MSTWTCLKCTHENEWQGSFGDDEVCSECQTVHETDWDYTDPYEGNISNWITKVKDEK